MPWGLINHLGYHAYLLGYMLQTKHEKGVSPVIGVILMVAVTVGLVALVSVTVFDLGGSVSESPDATVDIEVDDNDGNITVSVLRNENVDTFTLEGESNTGVDLPTSVGSSETIDESGESGNIQVVATVGDSEEVLRSEEFDFS